MNHTIYSMCQHYCNQVYVLVSASCLDIKKIVSYVLSNGVTNFTTVVLGVKVSSASFIIHVTVLWLWFPLVHSEVVQNAASYHYGATLSGAILTSECST